MHILPNSLLQVYASPSVRQRLKSRRDPISFFGKLRDALRCTEDQWSLVCFNGDYFEAVEVEEVTSTQVTFRHGNGRAAVPLSQLSLESRARLRAGAAAVTKSPVRLEPDLPRARA